MTKKDPTIKSQKVRCKSCKKEISPAKDDFGMALLWPINGKEQEIHLCSQKCWEEFRKEITK